MRCRRLLLPACPFMSLRTSAHTGVAIRSSRAGLQDMTCASQDPVLFSVLARKERKRRARCKKEKGAFTRVSCWQALSRSPRISGLFPGTGCNRGIVCRHCFRAETLRLALHGAGGEVFAPSSRRSLGNPTGARGPPWPFQLGRVKGGEEFGIFPSLAPLLLQLFFGRAKKS